MRGEKVNKTGELNFNILYAKIFYVCKDMLLSHFVT